MSDKTPQTYNFVPQHYIMDPEHEDLLFDGRPNC